MKVYELENEILNKLSQKAERFGEPLEQAWFDPFFWHPQEMMMLKQQIRIVEEFRGLMNDSRSFLEIRRKGKHRKKYTVSDLVGEGQLLPMVDVSAPTWHSEMDGPILLEHVFVAGCIAHFLYSNLEAFNLSILKFTRCFGSFGELLLTSTDGAKTKLVNEDYLVRSQQLIIQGDA